MSGLRVVYIGGYTRSGSTLLDRLLGTFPGAVSVGEVRHIWSMGLIEDRFCGCGEPFSACPFWRPVVAEAFPALTKAEAGRLNAQEKWLLKARHTPALLRPGPLKGRLRRAREEFVATRGRLYSAIASVSGRSLIVDSSKNPSYGLLLATIPELDVRTLHLVRDSRATSFSWLRVKSDPRRAGATDYFPRRRAHVSSSWWAANALLMETISRFGPRRHLRVRYEDLVANPDGELGRIARRLGVAGPAPETNQVSPGGSSPAPVSRRVGRWVGGEGLAAAFDLPVHHSIGGNPVRFVQGRVAVSEDAEWKSAMRRRDRAVVTAITWPLLLRYGYLGRR